jgi:arsenite-transporting ATPase
MADEIMDPSLQNIIDSKTLRWVFVGGKGGVGKTTTSCSLAVELAKHRESVLLISTDPAHNLSDAFGQKFSSKPTLVPGFENLFAMEINPSTEISEELENAESKSFFSEVATSIPGIDEAMSFAELMKQVQSMSYSTIVFDTAPTGHTLRLLSFPTVIEKAFEKINSLKGRFSGLFGQVAGMLGMGNQDESFMGKLEEIQTSVRQINAHFQNPEVTTFVCVCIPEFLSLFETERYVFHSRLFSCSCS